MPRWTPRRLLSLAPTEQGGRVGGQLRPCLHVQNHLFMSAATASGYGLRQTYINLSSFIAPIGFTLLPGLVMLDLYCLIITVRCLFFYLQVLKKYLWSKFCVLSFHLGHMNCEHQFCQSQRKLTVTCESILLLLLFIISLKESSSREMTIPERFCHFYWIKNFSHGCRNF